MTGQGWSAAEYRCGRCPAAWTSATEGQHIARVRLHHELHLAAEALRRMSPELTQDAALSAAAQLVGTIVHDQCDPARIASLRPAYAYEATYG